MVKEQFNLVLDELVTRHREFFETKAALLLIKEPECINAVVKISKKIIEIFEQYPDEIKFVISEQPKVVHDLYSPELYAHLNKTAQSPYDDMIQALKQAEVNPTQALHVHMCFIYRIYDHLSLAKKNVALKQELVAKIFSANLFSDRARKESSSSTQASYKQGICRLAFFNKKISSTSTHKPAKEKFTVDTSTDFYKTAAEFRMPTVCGPSGHTGSVVLLASLVNLFNEKEWHDYALIVASFLVIAGCHSFHESMMVSKTAGVKYEYGNYRSMFSCKADSQGMSDLFVENNHLMQR